MKQFFTLLFTLALIHQSQAQSWEPFVFDQLSYYKQTQANGSKKVETFLLDKFGMYNGFYSYIFNGYGDLPDECYTKLGNELKGTFYINQDKLEYLQMVGADKFLYRNAGTSNYIEFRPKAAVGTSWTTNGLTFTCSDKVLKNVLGIEDSVRIFKCTTAPFDTIEIELSKNYGFTKFLPFNEFFDPTAQNGRSPYFELIGYKYGNTKIGYQQPQFSDYFPLNVGDEQYWKHYYRKSSVVINDFYYDKITKAYHSADSVYYEFDRKVIENGIVKESLQGSKYYLKSKYGKIVEGKTSWYGSTGKVVSQFFSPTATKAFWMWPIYTEQENGKTINKLTLFYLT